MQPTTVRERLGSLATAIDELLAENAELATENERLHAAEQESLVREVAELRRRVSAAATALMPFARAFDALPESTKSQLAAEVSISARVTHLRDARLVADAFDGEPE